VRVVLGLTAKSDKVNELRSVLLELAAQSRQETGCVHYDVLQNTVDRCDFALAEEWTTEAALDAHLKTQHVQEAFSKGIPLLAKEPDSRRYSVVR
jgi:quinol monooxygenase YgiN